MEPDLNKKLLQKAIFLLARRSHSRAELRDKLISFGGTKGVDPVLDKLEQLKLLNDEDYAYNSAVRWIKQQGWGTIRIYDRLIRMGVAASVVESAIQKVHSELSEDESLEAYLKRLSRTDFPPEDRRGLRKLIVSLQRRGFPEETILTVLRKHIPAAAWKDLYSGE